MTIIGMWSIIRDMKQSELGATSDSERNALRAVVEVLILGEPFALALSSASGLTLTQIRTLHIVRHGGVYAGSVAHALGVPASSLSRILERLEQRGLVARAVDRADRRRVVVAVTPAGAAFVDGLPGLGQSRIGQAVHALGEDEREALVRGVTALTEASRRLLDGTRQANVDAYVEEETVGGYGI